SHRMILRPEAQLQGHSPEALLDSILSAAPVPQDRARVCGPRAHRVRDGGGGVALAASRWWLRRRPELIATREITPPRVQQGERAVAVLQLTNAGAHRSPPMLVTERVGGRRVGVRLPSLPRGASTTVSYDLPTDRRGLHLVGPLTMA